MNVNNTCRVLFPLVCFLGLLNVKSLLQASKRFRSFQDLRKRCDSFKINKLHRLHCKFREGTIDLEGA